jgi:DNA-binding beta-propeller fold protein YncE
MADREAPDGPYFVVSGRWDNNVALVSLNAALDPSNNLTDRAIVSRIRTTPDIEFGGRRVPASGQPVSVAIPAAGDIAFVVNHSGTVSPQAAAAFQHGHPGTIAVIDLKKAFEPQSDGTLAAVAAIVPTGRAGPVGCAVTPDQRYLAVTSAEAPGREDGGATVTLFDIATRQVAAQVAQPLRRAGATPSVHSAPHETFGAFPCANGVAASPRHGGVLFTANGGTDDVSVISLQRALSGAGEASEIARVSVEAGPFGVAVSPDGGLAAVASRESARTGVEGRTISFLDVDRAVSGRRGAEVARLRIGVDDDMTPTRPFSVAFTPAGGQVVATAFRSNTVSLIDVADALAGQGEAARLRLETPDGAPARPRGVVVTPDGRYAAVVGGAKGASGSSLLFIVALDTFHVAGIVSRIGNESYFLDVLPVRPAP